MIYFISHPNYTLCQEKTSKIYSPLGDFPHHPQPLRIPLNNLLTHKKKLICPIAAETNSMNANIKLYDILFILSNQ